MFILGRETVLMTGVFGTPAFDLFHDAASMKYDNIIY